MFLKLNKRKQKILIIVGIILLVLIILPAIIPYKGLKKFRSQQNSTCFYSAEGKLLYIMPLEEGLRREYIPLKDIPDEVKRVFIEEEDRHFWFHPGVDFAAIARSSKYNRENNRIVSGASTMTMQLVRMISPRENGKVNFWVKLEEAVRAVFLEMKLSKKEILELYLNNVPFGFQVEGVSSAAKFFYGTELCNLNEEQIRQMAMVPRRPSLYGKKIIAQRGEDFCPYTYPDEAPHYIRYLIASGKKLPDRMDLCLSGELTQLIQTELQNLLSQYADSRISNGAVVVLENETGNVVAWVGNGSFENEINGQVDGVSAKHQAGSSMKPFLYALALEEGMPPSSILADIPKDYGGQNVYVPLNFNNRYNGPVRMRVALASSLNIPAVDLLYQLGIESYFQKLQLLGFDSLKNSESSTGLSLALGSNEVSLLELTRAFSVFPNDGLLNGNRVYTKDTARIICDFLSDRAAQSLGFGNSKVFKTEYPAIFKTGTANQFQDILALGATTKYTVGVWMGNLNGETVVKKTGSSIPAQIARKVLDYLTLEISSYVPGSMEFKSPEKFTKVNVCSLSGMKPTSECSSVSLEFVANSLIKEREECSWHFNSSGKIEIKYPSEYQHWASGQNMAGKGTENFNSQPLSFSFPTDGATFLYDSNLPASVQKIDVMAFGGDSDTVQLYLDGKLVPRREKRLVWSIPLERGKHKLTLKDKNEKFERIIFVK